MFLHFREDVVPIKLVPLSSATDLSPTPPTPLHPTLEKYKDALPQSTTAGSREQVLQQTAEKQRNAEEEPPPRFRGIISECFEAYLGGWIRYEQNNLKNLIPAVEDPQENHPAREGEDEEEDAGEDSRYIFPSAPLLFDGIRKVMIKCSSFGISAVMWEVFGVFKYSVQHYCHCMRDRLKQVGCYRIG